MNYDEFISGKLARVPASGFSARVSKTHLFDFQRDLVSWALRRGRAAIFAATGLGKSRMEITWAKHVAKHTGRPVLMLAPLAVARQTVGEGTKIGIDVKLCRDQSDVVPTINVTNYDRLHLFDASSFSGIVLDESSIIKHHTARTLATLIESFGSTPYRLCATATPSPNDYVELGTHAEFLGICTRAEMLAEFFVHDGGETQKWRLKGHARAAFWQFVASWGALIRSPEDLGYDGSAYVLPPLTIRHHTIEASEEAVRESGMLFAAPAATLMERRAARRGSVADRVARCVEKVVESWANQGLNIGELTTRPIAKSGSKTREPRTENTPIAGEQRTSVEEKRPTRKPRGNTSAHTTLRTSSGTENEASDSHSRDTVSPRTNSSPCSIVREGSAPSAPKRPEVGDSTSTIAMQPEMSAASSAIHATSGSASFATANLLSGLQGMEMRRTTSPKPDSWLIFCDLNAEQDALEHLFGDLAFSVRGSTDNDEKESSILGWIAGDRPVMISKVSIVGFGCNFQHCHRMAFVGVTDSWEAYHQATKRIHRFGQTSECFVDIFASELEGAVIANLARKQRDAETMAEELSREAGESVRASVLGSKRVVNTYAAHKAMTVPDWIVGEAS